MARPERDVSGRRVFAQEMPLLSTDRNREGSFQTLLADRPSTVMVSRLTRPSVSRCVDQAVSSETCRGTIGSRPAIDQESRRPQTHDG